MSSTHDPSKRPLPSSSMAEPEVVEVKAGTFKDRCLSFLDQVRDGEVEVVVTKRGTPVARLVPVAGAAPSAFGFMRGTLLSEGDIVSPDFEAWERVG